MIYVTSDLHGYPLEKFKSHLEKIGFSDSDRLYILGDVIDRGSDGVAILRWMMSKPNVGLILGNHEAMMLDCSLLFDEITEENADEIDYASVRKISVWEMNGANPTIEALKVLDPEERCAIFDYVSAAPMYDRVSAGGKSFVLVHGGLGNFDEKKPLYCYSDYDLLWTRPEISDRYSNEFVTVFGHTPTLYYHKSYRGKMIRTDTWINIDMGAASGNTPMILRLDDLKEFYF